MEFIESILSGIIGGLITGLFFYILQERNSSRSKNSFLKALKQPNKWKQISGEQYIHEDKPDFTIDFSQDLGEVSPIFYGNHHFPDGNHNSRIMIEMSIFNKPIMRSMFMLLDGGRYFIPLPQSKYCNEEGSEESHYIFWDFDSVDFDLYKIIGRAYDNKSPVDIANMLKIRTNLIISAR